jgi:hypothetical protein
LTAGEVSGQLSRIGDTQQVATRSCVS